MSDIISDTSLKVRVSAAEWAALKAENERLKKSEKRVSKAYSEIVETLDRFEAENERLEDENERLRSAIARALDELPRHVVWSDVTQRRLVQQEIDNTQRVLRAALKQEQKDE